MSFSPTEKLKLRLLDAKPIQYEGMQYLFLRDPLELTQNTLMIPEPMIPALALSDGTRSLAGIRGALALRYGLMISLERLEEFFTRLDDAYLLENERAQAAIEQARRDFSKAAFRPAANAGLSYPNDPGELAEFIKGFFDRLDGAQPALNGTVRGIVSPHIDYERGGPVYAQVWGSAAESVREAELAIIFGTDHFSEGFPFSLTRQNYATPFGLLPTEKDIVNRLARVMDETLGPGAAFAGELHHRREHSIELAAVWMQYARGGEMIPIVPILCGPLDTDGQAGELSFVQPFLDVLKEAMQGRKTIVIAAGDMAHVGPAFGGEPVDPLALQEVTAEDHKLIQAVCQGDAQAFYGAIRRVNDQNNVCGVWPIYLTLRLLAPASGQRLGYATCPADEDNTSVVTICGVTLQ